MKFFVTRALHKLRFLKQVNLVVERPLNGKIVNIPVINGLGYDNLHITELWMSSLLRMLLAKTKGTFIDVGVNVGQTLLKLRSVDTDIDYVGFEPNPKCIYYSEKLIEANNYHNCRLIPVGLADMDGVLQLNLYSQTDTDSAASLIENFRPSERVFKKIFVPVNRFDTVNRILNVDSVSIVKIDVEGAELEVLQGLVEVVRVKRPVIIMEILPAYKADNTVRIERQQKIEKIIQSINYVIFRIIKGTNTVEKLERLSEVGIHGNREWCDYLMVPEEKSTEISSIK